MIRRFFAAIALVVGVVALTACGGGRVETPVGNVDLPSVGVSADIPTNLSEIKEVGIDQGLQSHGFKPNDTKTEYTKGDITITVNQGKATGVKYKNQPLACNVTNDSILAGVLANATGATEQEVAEKFCGVS